MPLLKKEPDFHPPDLFELPAEEFPWWVIHVQSRQEKVLARFCLERAIPFYLPQAEKKTKRNGRNFTSYIPLFPGYVFLRGSREQRALALRSNVIASSLEVIDQELLASELRQIRDLQTSGHALVPYEEIGAGDPVKLTDGIFKGYTGVVVRERGEMRLVVSISLIRRSVLVDVSRDGVAPVKKTA
jgi:transcriptional antiterminator RfaH